ncbi:hypothetical protein PAXINDRAFT_18172 [Paxillus involutus ATCC 200175]|uniref:Protein kinase domain-containing protein n=1 Tax=Paxillus involutus ATCC 200175 TaxID=664439 RepID=A0A0C9TCH9_PAXIN|nr:hypothetical protein PAXINDRAFT_18172 [Paxillus involutus ATCC 200175]
MLSHTSRPPLDLTVHLSRRGIYPASYEVAVQSIRSYDLDHHDIRQKNKTLRQELEDRARLEHENIIPLLGRNGEWLSLRDRLELLKDVAAGLLFTFVLYRPRRPHGTSGRALFSVPDSNIIMEPLEITYSPMNGAIRWA